MKTWLTAFCFSACSLIAAPSSAITVSELGGADQKDRVFVISRVFAQGEISNFAQARIAGQLLLTQCDVKTRWPDNSLQHAIVSFRADLESRESITVDFVNQLDGNNSGFLSKQQIFDSESPWASHLGAQIVATEGITQLVDLRTMLEDWPGDDAGPDSLGVRYWLKGPIVTQLIVEDKDPASLRYDFGWDCSTNDFPCSGSWASSRELSRKSLHPVFVVTLFPGSAALKVEMILENTWVTKLKDQNYNLELRLGHPASPASVYSRPNFPHYAKTRWRKVFWSGGAPGPVKIDHNLAYLIHTRVLPSYDLSKRVDTRAVDSEFAKFAATDQGDLNGNAQWQKRFPTGGARPDIGLYPRWYVRYLYTFDGKMQAVLDGNAACSGHAPIHLRESDASKMFDKLGQIPAAGRVVSLEARPGDLPPPLMPLSNAHGWVVDQAHQPDTAFIPYLTQGDWYYVEELWFWSAYNLRAGAAGNCYYCRHDDWGYLPQPLQTRGKAWAMRTLIDTAFVSPDGSPEKAHFIQKLENNVAVEEGKLAISDGHFFDPTPGSRWWWGRNVVATQAGAAVPYGGSENPVGFLNYDSACAAPVNQDLDFAHRVRYCDAPWMHHFVLLVWSHGREKGFPFDALLRRSMNVLIHEVLDPDSNPWLVGAFHFPVIRRSDNQWFASWKEMRDAWGAPVLESTSWKQVAPSADDSDVEGGYPHIARAAASFALPYADGPLTGEGTWRWLDQNVGYQVLLNANPKWAFVPRADPAGASIPHRAHRPPQAPF